MTRRIEINPGEHFMIADRTILVTEYESVIADVFKIGAPDHRAAYLLTFTGKVNTRDETDTVTLALSPEDALALQGVLLDGLEMLAGIRKPGDHS